MTDIENSIERIQNTLDFLEQESKYVENSTQWQTYLEHKQALETALAILKSYPVRNDIITCKECIYDGLSICPLSYIEKHTLQFINHNGDFYCKKGERRNED